MTATNPTPAPASHDLVEVSTDTATMIPTPPKLHSRVAPKSPWTASDYSGIVSGSGAMKLASSAVAPLVAAARGYTLVDPANFADFADRRGIGDRRSKAGKQFRNLFMDGGDALIMPWFRLDQMQDDATELVAQPDTTVQYRPSNPRINEQGKVVKYEFLAGGGTFLDTHPSVHKRWFTTAPRYLVAEGLLKGDSALTAQLRSWFEDDVLAARPEDTQNRTIAMRRLATLLDAIPHSERTAIISIAGVGNWRQNPEWWSVRVPDKDVLIAFDGDVESNWNVWSMAADMYHYLVDVKKARPALVTLSSNPAAAEALQLDPHLGLDDFFRSHGSWADVDSMIEIDLPARPARANSAQIGDWRIHPDGLSAQEYVETPTEGPQKGLGHWVSRVPIGGRIASSEIHRPATDEETDGKPFGTGLDEAHHPSFCRIELAWEDKVTNLPVYATITGPTKILNYPPNEWDRQGATIPRIVAHHPAWPPVKGANWLRAVKDNRSDELDSRTVWSTMGWVPVSGEESQAFIVGKQVIAASEDAVNGTLPGVLGNQLTNAERFGLHDVYTGPGLTDPNGKYNLAEDLRTLLDTYWHNTPWLNSKIAATALAIALRPAVPLPTSVAAYFVGAPQKGKSWTARQCMSFWQGRPATWERTLPGSASDTFATAESAVSKTPIWVVDDIAPSPDRKTAEMQEAKIGELIRAVHNKLGKRRMNRDMTEREVPTPMALTIFTAENEAPVQSIRERVVTVEFTGLNGDSMQAADALAYKTTVASRVTGAIIRMYIERGRAEGWESLVTTLRNERELSIETAREVLGELGVAPGDRSRPAEIAADLSMGLHALADLLIEADMSEAARLIGWSDNTKWLYLITEQISLGHQNKPQMSPGRVLIDCIRGLLASGAGHIVNIDSPGSPPLMGENQATSNSLMGWTVDQEGGLHKRGSTLGYLSHVGAHNGKKAGYVLYILPDDAFRLAQQNYPKLIPYGASATNSWRNAWGLRLTHHRYLDDGKTGLTRQVTVKGSDTRLRGVPLSMEVLFGHDAD